MMHERMLKGAHFYDGLVENAGGHDIGHCVLFSGVPLEWGAIKKFNDMYELCRQLDVPLRTAFVAHNADANSPWGLFELGSADPVQFGFWHAAGPHFRFGQEMASIKSCRWAVLDFPILRGTEFVSAIGQNVPVEAYSELQVTGFKLKPEIIAALKAGDPMSPELVQALRDAGRLVDEEHVDGVSTRARRFTVNLEPRPDKGWLGILVEQRKPGTRDSMAQSDVLWGVLDRFFKRGETAVGSALIVGTEPIKLGQFFPGSGGGMAI